MGGLEAAANSGGGDERTNGGEGRAGGGACATGRADGVAGREGRAPAGGLQEGRANMQVTAGDGAGAEQFDLHCWGESLSPPTPSG